MSSDTSAQLNQKIRAHVEKNPKQPFSTSSSLLLLTPLRTLIFGDNPSEKVNAISLLATLTDRIPKSEENDLFYDDLLFKELFGLIPFDIKTSTLVSILRIASVYMTGKISTHTLPILLAIQKQLNILDLLCDKFADDSISVIEFVTKLMTCCVENEYPDLILFMRSLSIHGFFNSITVLAEDSHLNPETKSKISKLNSSFIEMKLFLAKIPIIEDSLSFNKIVDEVLELFLQNLSETGKTATSADFAKAGLTKYAKKFIVSNYNSDIILAFLIFWKDPNKTFKKEFVEHLLFSSGDDLVFPVASIGVKVDEYLNDEVLGTDSYPFLKEVLFVAQELFFSSMLNMLRIWRSSKATSDDLSILITHLKGVMRFANSQLKPKRDLLSVRTVIGSLILLTADEIKNLQLEDWKENEEATELEFGLNIFHEYLRSEVLEFVKEQRLLKLSKGSWVYSENPTEMALQGKKPQVYYMILSPNNSAVIYKEFKSKTKIPPNIDKTGRYLNINTIASFESTNNDKEIEPTDKRLISLKSRTSFNKIILKNKSRKTLLSFYTDTTEASYIWSDGLKLMSNAKYNDLSDDTKQQIESLIEVRKSCQLANLNDEDLNYLKQLLTKKDVNQELIYDFKTLESLTSEFCYD